METSPEVNDKIEINNNPEANDKYIRGWSWFAFLGSWIYLFVHKQKKMAWKFFIFFIITQLIDYVPLIKLQAKNFGFILGLIYLGYTIWLGVRGRELVWKSGVYTSIEEFKKRQKFAAKLIISFMVVMIIINIFIAALNMSKLISTPEAINQKIEEQALLKAKANDSSVNDIEFSQGYQKGGVEGKSDIAPSFIADQTTSFKIGYQYGYIVSCMQLRNDQNICVNKLTGK